MGEIEVRGQKSEVSNGKYRQVAVDRAALVESMLRNVTERAGALRARGLSGPAARPAPTKDIIPQAGRLCHQRLCHQQHNRTLLIEKFLTEYNSTNSILYNILGHVAKSTLYMWIRDYKEGGIDALVPHYGKPPKIMDQEKQYLESILSTNHIRTGNAIHVMRFIMKRDGIKSASSVSTLRRWIERFRNGRNQDHC